MTLKRSSFLVLTALFLSFAACSDDDEDMGTGLANDDLTVALTWDEPLADIDLDLRTADNQNVGSSFSSGGITHSGDDLRGPGDETITFTESATDGTYTVFLEIFSGSGDIPYTLTITSADGRITESDVLNLATNDEKTILFTKTGGTVRFQ